MESEFEVERERRSGLRRMGVFLVIGEREREREREEAKR
jgi:hypothetical protein